MRIALLADIHANFEALKAVRLACQAEHISSLVNLGDVVGYGPEPQACVHELRGMAIENIQGNHEAGVLGLPTLAPSSSTQQTWAHARGELTPDDMDYLKEFQPRFELGDRLLCVHGSPRDRDEYVRTRVGMKRVLQTSAAWVCALGHTHRQFVFDGRELLRGPVELALHDSKRYVVNPGSVGQPRDGDPRAAFAILDLDAKSIALRRIPYDVDSTARKIVDAGLPGLFAERLRNAT